jgi:hypothetical protein
MARPVINTFSASTTFFSQLGALLFRQLVQKMTSGTSKAGGGGTSTRRESHNASRLQASEYTTCSNIADACMHSSCSTPY